MGMLAAPTMPAAVVPAVAPTATHETASLTAPAVVSADAPSANVAATVPEVALGVDSTAASITNPVIAPALAPVPISNTTSAIDVLQELSSIADNYVGPVLSAGARAPLEAKMSPEVKVPAETKMSPEAKRSP